MVDPVSSRPSVNVDESAQARKSEAERQSRRAESAEHEEERQEERDSAEISDEGKKRSEAEHSRS